MFTRTQTFIIMGFWYVIDNGGITLPNGNYESIIPNCGYGKVDVCKADVVDLRIFLFNFDNFIHISQ